MPCEIWLKPSTETETKGAGLCMSDIPPFLTSTKLSSVPGLVHGFFTRAGGVSGPPYDSLNASWSNGDSAQAVSENLSRIMAALGLERLVSSRQVHGDVINVVGESTLRSFKARPPILLADPGDALVTGISDTGLLIKIADCQSVFLVDPERRMCANVHSGWRGSVQNVAGKTVEYLRERFNCLPGRMLAAVGPSLGPCCAEYVNFRNEFPPDLWHFQTRPAYFDFWAMTRHQLVEAGIPNENIDILGRCTVCEKSTFFSYRGERDTGRMAAVIGWKG